MLAIFLVRSLSVWDMPYTLLEKLVGARTLAARAFRNRSLARCWGCRCRQDTLPFLVQPPELLSGLETEKGCYQLRQGSFVCRFSIQEPKSFKENNLIKRNSLKVSQLSFSLLYSFPQDATSNIACWCPYSIHHPPGKLV